MSLQADLQAAVDKAVSAVRFFRLGTASRNRTTSSALNTTGSLRGSRA
ncbi:MAG: hypothetical protein H7841_18460 [Magnetospirillum sp. WYHS-4]